MKPSIWYFAVCFYCVFCCGCATYRKSVTDDFRDTIIANAGVGLGLHADVKVTSMLHPGIGYAGVWGNVGLQDRYTPLVFPSMEASMFPLWLFTPLWEDSSDRYFTSETLRLGNGRLSSREFPVDEPFIAGSLFDFPAVTQFQAYGPDKLAQHPSMLKSNVELAYTDRPMGIECGVGLLILRVRLGFDPVEALDLLTTAFGWDLLQDNRKEVTSAPTDPSPPSTPSSAPST